MSESVNVVCVRVYLDAGSTGDQKRPLDPLDLESQEVELPTVHTGNRTCVLLPE